VQGAQAPYVWHRYMLDVTAVSWTTAHELYARHGVASQSYYGHLGGLLTVTYEYDETATSTVLNSLVMALGESSATLRTSTDKEVFSIDRLIEEPATVTLVQSGVWITANCGTTSDTLSVKLGSQTVTAYTPTSGAGMSGMLTIFQRIDANSNKGAALTLARGKNTFTSEYYAATVDRIGNLSSLLYLNYTSGKHTSGTEAHAQSRYYILRASETANQSSYVTVTPTAPEIIESSYYLLSASPVMYLNGITGTLITLVLQIEKAAGGWVDLFNTISILSGERQMSISMGIGRTLFKRYPTDPDTAREDIETGRTWRYTGMLTHLGLGLWLTYHSQTWTISGNVTDYADLDGAGITVNLYRSDTKELIGTTTTTTGGAYTFTWYDNTIPVFAEVYEDATHAGRSIDAVAE